MINTNQDPAAKGGTDLLPCPFCGHDGKIKEDQSAKGIAEGMPPFVACGNTDCVYSIFQVEITVWNCRATPKEGKPLDLGDIRAACDKFDLAVGDHSLTESTRALCDRVEALETERAPLMWTSTIPSQDNWYWYRVQGQEKQSIDRFEMRNGKLCWYSAAAGGWVPVTWSLEFAGPIPEPTPGPEGAA